MSNGHIVFGFFDVILTVSTFFKLKMHNLIDTQLSLSVYHKSNQ